MGSDCCMYTFYKCDSPVFGVSQRKVAVLGAIREHQVNDIGFTADINTDVKWVDFGHRLSLKFGVFNQLGNTHDHGASTPSHIRIQSEEV